MLNLKTRVKSGELSPKEAITLLIGNAENPSQVMASRTYRWLSSSNAQKRYKKAANKVQ